MRAVVRSGWPADDPDLGTWLDRLFAPPPRESTEGPWYVLAANAAELPVGIFEYPQTINVTGSNALVVDNARYMAVALLGRALQRQAAGDPAAMLPALRVTLTLARTLNNGSGIDGLRAGNDVERFALAALDRWISPSPAAAWAIGLRAIRMPLPAGLAALAADVWIKQVSPSPGMLREAIASLELLDVPEPFDPTPYLLAERYALRETMKAPGQWLPRMITPPGGNPDAPNAEVDLVGMGWAVPWERERTRRLIGLGFEAGPTQRLFVLDRPARCRVSHPPQSDPGRVDREQSAAARVPPRWDPQACSAGVPGSAGGISRHTARTRRGRLSSPIAGRPLRQHPRVEIPDLHG